MKYLLIASLLSVWLLVSVFMFDISNKPKSYNKKTNIKTKRVKWIVEKTDTSFTLKGESLLKKGEELRICDMYIDEKGNLYEFFNGTWELATEAK